ncbi:MAG: site-specific integrase [Oscillospiraceae bacterium]|jgi:integrase|nr:site-specific integrase [Oscillospiraceae bacterium]
MPKNRMSKRADGWYATTYVVNDPVTRKKTRRCFYGKTRADARRKLDEFKRSLDSGAVIDKTSVSTWRDKWLKTYKAGVGYGTRKTYERDVSLIKEAIGTKRVADVKPIDVQGIINSRAGLSASAIHKTAMTLRSIFHAARINGKCLQNPCDSMDIPRGGKGTHKFLDKAIQNLISSTWSGHRFGPAAMFMLYGGLRRGECFFLNLDEHISDNRIHIRGVVHHESNRAVAGRTKSESGERDIPIMKPLAAVIASRSGPLCPSAKGTLMTESAFKRVWESYKSYLELHINAVKSKRWAAKDQLAQWKTIDIQCHDLRHTYCSLLYEMGVSVKSAQEWLVHTDAKMTMEIYTHLSNKQRARDESLIEAYFESDVVENVVERR